MVVVFLTFCGMLYCNLFLNDIVRCKVYLTMTFGDISITYSTRTFEIALLTNDNVNAILLKMYYVLYYDFSFTFLTYYTRTFFPNVTHTI